MLTPCSFVEDIAIQLFPLCNIIIEALKYRKINKIKKIWIRPKDMDIFYKSVNFTKS